jgi:hypothetical protein
LISCSLGANPEHQRKLALLEKFRTQGIVGGWNSNPTAFKFKGFVDFPINNLGVVLQSSVVAKLRQVFDRISFNGVK